MQRPLATSPRDAPPRSIDGVPVRGPLPAGGALRAVLERVPWPARDLARPPEGSGLRPIRGDGGLPLVGHTLEALHGGPNYARTWYERYGPVSWTHFLGRRIVSLMGPDAVEVALVNRDRAFSQQAWDYFIGPFFRRGLMLLDFDEHLHHRRIMQTAFARPRLTAYMERVDATVRDGVRHWPAPGTLRVLPELKQLSLGVATRIFMGEEPGAEAPELTAAFIATVRAGTSIIRHPVPYGRWQAGLKGRRVLEEHVRARVPAKRRSGGEDLFAALCHATTEEGDRFTDDDVVNHMIFLMMAAHDTSTITTSSALYNLGAHPEWQERAREEAMSFAGTDLDPDALDRMEVLDLVIKESLRLVAPVPSLARQTVKDTEVLGHHLPAGTAVMVAPWFNHFVPECWTDPYAFDPERFAEPRREDRSHRYAWIPFGGGVHKCIGMHFGTFEVKLLLHHLLRTYRWELTPGYRIRWDVTSLPVPADGLPLQIRRL